MADNALRLAVTIRDESARVLEVRDQLVDFLTLQAGVRVTVFGTPDQIKVGRKHFDLMLVLGGDGTILRTCRQFGSRQFPIMGINLGTLGFLADLSPDEFQTRFPEIRQHKFTVVPHLMFSCRLIHDDGTQENHLGLNEVAVLCGAALKILQVHLAIDGKAVTTYRCDGLIISTPVGSTAHSLAAGGPLLRQDLQAFVITPVSPHTLTNRPLVDHADSVYVMTFPEVPEGATLVIDGQIKLPLRPGDRIEVRKAPVCFQFARLTDHSYYKTLHQKLGWGGQAGGNGK